MNERIERRGYVRGPFYFPAKVFTSTYDFNIFSGVSGLLWIDLSLLYQLQLGASDAYLAIQSQSRFTVPFKVLKMPAQSDCAVSPADSCFFRCDRCAGFSSSPKLSPTVATYVVSLRGQTCINRTE